MHLEAFSFLFATCGVAAALLITFLEGESAVSLAICVAVFAAGLGLMIATAPLLLLEAVVERLRSSASAVAGSAQLVAASGASFLVAVFHDSTSTPMLLIMGGLLAIGALGFVLKGSITTPVGDAVGTGITPRPLRRSRRALLTHRAPPSGRT